MSEIVGIGASVYDTLIVTEGFPAEDTKLQATGTMIQGGGPCATALVAARILGATCEYMGCVGNDAYGRFLMDDFQKYGVGTEHTIRKDGCISFHSFVLLNSQNSSRTCIWNRGTVPELQPEEMNIGAVKSAKILHLDGHQLDAAIQAAMVARECGVKVSLDAGGVYPGIERLLPYVDFLIPSEEFAVAVTGQSDVRKAASVLFAKYKPEVLIITQGAKGGFLFHGEEYAPYRSFRVEAVDSNGAGDVFHGAFLAGYGKGMNFRKAAQFASAAAALKCTQVGARRSVPTYENTIQFLRRNGYADF